MDPNTAQWILSTIIQGSIALLGITALFTIFAIGMFSRDEIPRARAVFGVAWSEGTFLATLFFSIISIFYGLFLMYIGGGIDSSILNLLVYFEIIFFFMVVVSFVLAVKVILQKVRL